VLSTARSARRHFEVRHEFRVPRPTIIIVVGRPVGFLAPRRLRTLLQRGRFVSPRRVRAAATVDSRYDRIVLMARVAFDNAAELIRRTGRGGRLPLTRDHTIVRYAVAFARLSAYCQDLRPFGQWVARAVRLGGRAGRIPELPTLAAQLASLPAVSPLAGLASMGGWAKVDTVTRAVHAAAKEHGVRSTAFSAAVQEFAPYWNFLVGAHLVTYDPGKREPDSLRRGFVIALVQWLPAYRLGPAQLGLLAAVVGIDAPIACAGEDDTVADAIARRASRYDRFWKLARKAPPILRTAANRLRRSTGATQRRRRTATARRR